MREFTLPIDSRLIFLPGVLAAIALGMVPSSASAQQRMSTEQVACGASGGTQTQCKLNGYATGVRIARDLSGICRQGGNWGFTDSSIWTNGGCRADFQVAYRVDPSDDGFIGGSKRTIVCGLTNGVRSECRTGGFATEVRLARNLGKVQCRQGENWDFSDSRIWTNRGCRGEFSVSARASNPGNSRTIDCGNADGSQVECRVGGYATSVRLVQDRGRVRCQQNSNWGHTDSFIWTNRGCRGRFEVTFRQQP